MLRVLYAFTWGNVDDIVQDFPGRPHNLMRISTDEQDMRRLGHWIHATVPGHAYGSHEYVNMYEVFLFIMRKRGIIP